MRKLFYILLIAILILLTLGFANYRGIFWYNEGFTLPYDVRGIDVSHYQGLIDWDEVKTDDVSFVFMKASEGSGHTDSYFSYNWEESKRVGIIRGAYHFFSMESSGKTQGEYFTSIVPKENDALPPVIDIEVDLSYSKTSVLNQVENMSLVLEDYYGKTPILYMDLNVYEAYYSGEDVDNPIWIREIYAHPDLFTKTNWSFWQFSDRGKIKGIEGNVDLNIYRYTYEELLKL